MRYASKYVRSLGLIIAAQLLFCVGQRETCAQQSASSTAAPSSGAPRDIRVRGTESAIDASIPDDPLVDKILAPYSAKVRELDAVVGKLKGNLRKNGIGGGSLGNFVADAIRVAGEAKLGKPVLLAITNSGGLRKNDITEGDLRASDVYQLLPFENALVALDLTGEQLRRFLDVVVLHRDAQSGARIRYRTNAEKQSEIVSAKLDAGRGGNEKDINPTAVYTIVTID